ncbi:MAG: serine/threonine-protein kinase [Kofleriaceae bacterium]
MRYHIERRIGAGAMADVYEATLEGDTGFQRKVAIKRLALDRQSDAGARASFLDEARIAGSLNHPGIVAVVDYGIVDGSPVQVLEWIDGLDGGQVIDRGTLSIAAACFVVAEVARALEFAHRAGVVHRDVKPSNILVSWSGHVKLADFGIALARERSQRTQTGIAKGTAAYMAPEQRVGGAVDARADVFAIGCTLHALVAGRSPIDAEAAPVDHELGRALAIDRAVPAQLREVLERACAARPADRYATMASFEQALDAATGELAAREGHRALLDWLATARAPQPKRALLDDLYGLNLHMVLAADADGSRQFRMEKAPVPIVPPRRSRWWIATVVAGIAAIAVVVVIVSRDPDEPASLPVATAQPVAAPPVVRQPPPPAPLVRSHPEPRPVAPRKRPPPPPTSEARGFVAIGGDAVHLGTIAIDGVRIGTAPRLVELAVGHHSIKVTFADGRTVGPVDVAVTELATRSRPLRPRL